MIYLLGESIQVSRMGQEDRKGRAEMDQEIPMSTSMCVFRVNILQRERLWVAN